MRLIKHYFKIRSKAYVFTFINIMLYLLFCYKVLYLVIHISLEIAEMKLLISEHHLTSPGTQVRALQGIFTEFSPTCNFHPIHL